MSDNFDVHVACSKNTYSPEERSHKFRSVNRFFIALNANGISGLIYDLLSLFKAKRETGAEDYIVILGSGPGLLLALFPSLRKRHLLIHPDGLEWKRKKWNPLTRIIIKMSWYLAVRYAEKLILDNKHVLNYVPERFITKTCICAYGADHLPRKNLSKSLIKGKYALVVARAEPENNLDLISDAFESVSDLKLIIISNFSRTRYGRQLQKKLTRNNDFYLIEAIYDDQELLQRYRVNCSIYIHGHSVGGTNPSLVEAMASGIPVMAWDNPFNRDTTHNAAQYFDSRESLIKLLKHVTDSELTTLAMRLRTIAEKYYRWERVKDDLLKAMEYNL
jgi:glycosyltransferase involved in cell wall biosynthesis